jgi:hypothetical protein
LVQVGVLVWFRAASTSQSYTDLRKSCPHMFLYCSLGRCSCQKALKASSSARGLHMTTALCVKPRLMLVLIDIWAIWTICWTLRGLTFHPSLHWDVASPFCASHK